MKRRCAIALLSSSLSAFTACGSPQDVGGRSREEQRLERELALRLAEARALLHVDGCLIQQCAAAPVGAKPCGGPWRYWAYCRTSTDEAALLAKLEEARQVEALLNQLTGAASDCRLLLPPPLRAIDGACTLE